MGRYIYVVHASLVDAENIYRKRQQLQKHPLRVRRLDFRCASFSAGSWGVVGEGTTPANFAPIQSTLPESIPTPVYSLISVQRSGGRLQHCEPHPALISGHESTASVTIIVNQDLERGTKREINN